MESYESPPDPVETSQDFSEWSDLDDDVYEASDLVCPPSSTPLFNDKTSAMLDDESEDQGLGNNSLACSVDSLVLYRRLMAQAVASIPDYGEKLNDFFQRMEEKNAAAEGGIGHAQNSTTEAGMDHQTSQSEP